MCWLTEPLTKEAVSNAREDGTSVRAEGATEWLAVFSASACSALAVERQGVRRSRQLRVPCRGWRAVRREMFLTS